MGKTKIRFKRIKIIICVLPNILKGIYEAIVIVNEHVRAEREFMKMIKGHNKQQKKSKRKRRGVSLRFKARSFISFAFKPLIDIFSMYKIGCRVSSYDPIKVTEDIIFYGSGNEEFYAILVDKEFFVRIDKKSFDRAGIYYAEPVIIK